MILNKHVPFKYKLKLCPGSCVFLTTIFARMNAMGVPTEMTADCTNLVCRLHFASNSSQSSSCKDSQGFQYRKNFSKPSGARNRAVTKILGAGAILDRSVREGCIIE